MAELESEVFDLSELPERCPGGLAFGECVGSVALLHTAENFVPERPTNLPKRRMVVVSEHRCNECDYGFITSFGMVGSELEQGSKFEVRYLPPDEQKRPTGSATVGIRDRMLDSVEADIVLPPETDLVE